MKPRKKQKIDEVKDTGELRKKDEVNKLKKVKKQRKEVVFEDAELSSDEEGLDEIVEDEDDQGGISIISRVDNRRNAHRQRIRQ